MDNGQEYRCSWTDGQWTRIQVELDGWTMKQNIGGVGRMDNEIEYRWSWTDGQWTRIQVQLDGWTMDKNIGGVGRMDNGHTIETDKK